MRIEFDEAVRTLEAFPAASRLATLHPRYVLADAQRSAGTEPCFWRYQEADRIWYHGFHLCPLPGVAGYDAVAAIQQNRVDEAKFGDAGGDLLDLPRGMGAGVIGTGFELAGVLVFDRQRLHSAPQNRRLRDCAAHDSRIKKCL